LPGKSCWQFNFKFDIEKDEHLPDAIHFLKNSGIEFDKFKTDGIDLEIFAEKFQTSGVIFNTDITWIVFHGSFDFGYILRTFCGHQLPEDMV